jgi:hypothetical protein
MSVVKLLEHYSDFVAPVVQQKRPLELSIADLKIVKTAIGVLLNATIGYGTQ